MHSRSKPKHIHGVMSPLPLGMDWSPPPRKLNGRDTVWPHDHRTGWSYCVTIPSWTVLSKSRNSDPVAVVSVQSPEGVTIMRGILRRFNDFLKVLTDRRCALEDWMTKLLSDIELARPVVVASFLELEATAMFACQIVDQNASNPNDDEKITSLSSLIHPNLSFLHSGGSSLLSSEYSSDTAYETS